MQKIALQNSCNDVVLALQVICPYILYAFRKSVNDATYSTVYWSDTPVKTYP